MTGVRYCADGPRRVETEFNVVTVETGGVGAGADAPARHRRRRAAAGAAATSSTTAAPASAPLPADARRSPLDVLAAMPGSGRSTARACSPSTGAVHAAAAFDRDGDVVLTSARTSAATTPSTRWSARLLLERRRSPADRLGLFVSGRASFEMVQKAWAAGFGTLVAVSAPTALAVDAARRAGLSLAGFVRGDRFNVYAPERLLDPTALVTLPRAV